MIQTVFSRIGWFFILLLLQIFVFNHVHILGYATPIPYIYALLILPANTPRWVYVAAGFVVGLFIDLFTNTPGVGAGSLCLSGLLIPSFLRLFSSEEMDENTFEPSCKTMEWSGFLKYAFLSTFIFCVAYFTLEAFSFFNWQALLINIGGSTLLTFIIVSAIELIRNK